MTDHRLHTLHNCRFLTIKTQLTIAYASLIFIIFCGACSSSKEFIIDIKTGEKIVGYSSDCKYQIGKTKKSDISEYFFKQMEKDSLSIYLVFNYASNNKESETLLAGWGNSRYITSKGLKPGDNMEKAIKLYGEPIATDLLYWEDRQNHIKWRFEGLFYSNMAVLIDTSKNNVVRGVSVGNQFELDKKFWRESEWFKK